MALDALGAEARQRGTGTPGYSWRFLFMSLCHARVMALVEERSQEEANELASTESELADLHPEVAVDVIHDLVQDSYISLTPARIHSYLPILVARDVEAELRSRRAA
jgi:hypothetical protein